MISTCLYNIMINNNSFWFLEKKKAYKKNRTLFFFRALFYASLQLTLKIFQVYLFFFSREKKRLCLNAN